VDSLKPLIYILAISAFVFHLAKPIASGFDSGGNFSRRRNLYFALTALGFLMPNFWLFTLVAAPLYIWAGRKDTNPAALYLLMLHVVPPIGTDIPFPGLNSLFSLDNYRLLTICVMIPVALRLRKSTDPERIRGTTFVDILILSYGLLQAILFVPPNPSTHVVYQDSFTNDLRTAFLAVIDSFVPFYVISRFCSKRDTIREALTAFCLACAVMSAIAIFESLRHWLVYTEIAVPWSGDPYLGFTKYRSGGLRAQVSSGNPLALGYMLAIACGFWAYLAPQVQSKRARIGVMLLLWLGIVFTYSRGPLAGAVLIYVVIAMLGRRALPRLIKGAFGALVLLLLVSLLPVGERLLRLLPFADKAGDEEMNFSVTYRQRLAERSWEIIQAHPIFGDQLALLKLDDLRQGEGIIDTVNTWAETAMFYGFVGVAIFSGAILIPMFRALRVSRQYLHSDPDFARLGAVLVACILGTLVMLVTCSFILGYQKLFYALAALAAAYAHLGQRQAVASREST
jgi:hypothetical protein